LIYTAIHSASLAKGGEQMDAGEPTTGTRDEHYNLISVLYHALHGAENCEAYAADAEAAGDERLSAFFSEAQDRQRDLADRAKGILGIEDLALGERGVTTLGTAETGTEIPPRTEPPPDATGRLVDVRGRATPEVGIPPEGMAGPEASPRTEPSGIRPGTEEARPKPEEPIARTEEAAPPRPEPSGDLPGTEPIREEMLPTRARGVPPAPEEIPPERAGEIPTVEEVPPPRAEEVPSGTPPQAPPGDVQRETSPEPSPRTQEWTGQTERNREEDKGLLERVADAARDALAGQEDPKREEPDGREASPREPRREDPPTRRS
jgi:hypothetical protein